MVLLLKYKIIELLKVGVKMISGNTGMNPIIRDNNFSRNIINNISTTSSPDSLSNLFMNSGFSYITPILPQIIENPLQNEAGNSIILSKEDFRLIENSINSPKDANEALSLLFAKYSS